MFWHYPRHKFKHVGKRNLLGMTLVLIVFTQFCVNIRIHGDTLAVEHFSAPKC